MQRLLNGTGQAIFADGIRTKPRRPWKASTSNLSAEGRVRARRDPAGARPRPGGTVKGGPPLLGSSRDASGVSSLPSRSLS